jgi:Tol biopolymer transport system component
MTDDRLHRAISDSLSDLASGSPTDYIEDVLAMTARTRQRPAWTFPGRYLSMTPALRFAAIAILAVSASLGVAALVSEPAPQAPAVGECPTPAASAPPPASLAPGATPAPVVIGDCEPWIAYDWFVGEDVAGTPAVKAVRPDGSDAHVVAHTAESHFADWTHDGARLAFTKWDGGPDEAAIWTVNADGSGEQRLVGCEQPCIQLYMPSWSPDDSKLVVARWDKPDGTNLGQRCYLETVDVTTLERTVILEGPEGGTELECYNTPRWSGDGRSIVFELADYLIDFVSGEGTLTGSSIAVIDADGAPDQAPRVLTDPALLATHPDWHPAEDLIVFGTRPLGDFQDEWLATNLYTIRADGTDLRQVTSYGNRDTRATFPTWTPDGQEIVFSYVEPTTGALSGDWGHRQLAYIRPDGTGLRVVPGVNGVEPRVRPLP